MAPEQICRIYRDRFQIKFNFRDAKQHLRLAALAWTRLELRHAAAPVPDSATPIQSTGARAPARLISQKLFTPLSLNKPKKRGLYL